MTICAVVVTYNRLELLKKCLTALFNQKCVINKIIVVNNGSTDGTTAWLKTLSNIEVIHQENVGGAGGFYTGIKYAIENNYDWIWCMDDDTEANLDTLEILKENTNIQYSAITPEVINSFGFAEYQHRGLINRNKIKINSLLNPIKKNEKDNLIKQIELSSFVGILINSLAIKKIGLPLKEYFIHYDDIEYSFRLLKYGNIILVPKAKIIHKNIADNNLKEIHFVNRIIFRKNYNSYWMKYYTFRNFIITIKKHYNKSIFNSISCILSLVKELIQIILFDDHKYKRMCIVILAYYDGLSINYDRNVNIIKLYLYK